MSYFLFEPCIKFHSPSPFIAMSKSGNLDKLQCTFSAIRLWVIIDHIFPTVKVTHANSSFNCSYNISVSTIYVTSDGDLMVSSNRGVLSQNKNGLVFSWGIFRNLNLCLSAFINEKYRPHFDAARHICNFHLWSNRWPKRRKIKGAQVHNIKKGSRVI